MTKKWRWKKTLKNDQRNDKCNDNQNDKNEKYFKDFQCVAGSILHNCSKLYIEIIWGKPLKFVKTIAGK